MDKGDKGQSSALYVWNGMCVFWGTSYYTNPHSHETLQLVFDIEKHFFLKAEGQDWNPFKSAIIKDGSLHQLDSNGGIQLFIYLDKDSDYAKSLSAKFLKHQSINSLDVPSLNKLCTDFFKRLLVVDDCNALYHGCINLLNHLVDVKPTIAIDVRVEKAIKFIAENQVRKFKVKLVADHVCLSESRLRHLFKTQVGQPIQNFMLWMKVVASLNLVLKGKPVSNSAYDAGFWDSSHMIRSYHELLGASPSAIKKYHHDFKVVACEGHNFYSFKTKLLKDWKDSTPYKIIETK